MDGCQLKKVTILRLAYCIKEVSEVPERSAASSLMVSDLADVDPQPDTYLVVMNAGADMFAHLAWLYDGIAAK